MFSSLVSKILFFLPKRPPILTFSNGNHAPTYNLVLWLTAASVLLRWVGDPANSPRQHTLVELLVSIAAYLISHLLAILTGLLLTWHVIMGNPRALRQIRSSNAADCKEIFRAKKVSGLDIFNQIDNKWEARALPNQRLVLAFGIDNCFSTTDKQYCSEFHAAADAKITLSDQRWAGLAGAARNAVRRELCTDKAVLKLTPLVQMISMKMALEVLLDIPVRDTHNDKAIKDLAEEINHQWLRSKGNYNCIVEADWKFSNQTKLLAALKTIFPHFSLADSRNNPMNFILPGYETLWRVVLRCFLETTARFHQHPDDQEAWQAILSQFGQNPTPAQLDDAHATSSGVSAKNIAEEALRLYPPTRRVYREFLTTTGRSEVSADIEACQRAAETWGKDAGRFKPDRWLCISADGVERGAFFPFGGSPFTCPAQLRKVGHLPFGVSMIALLVGVLAEEVKGKWKVDDAGLSKCGAPLETDREAYEDLQLHRVRVDKGRVTRARSVSI